MSTGTPAAAATMLAAGLTTTCLRRPSYGLPTSSMPSTCGWNGRHAGADGVDVAEQLVRRLAAVTLEEQQRAGLRARRRRRR